MNAHFLEAVPIKVLSRTENGGGVIEIPIMATATGEMDLTVALMRELVLNFDAFPVVPVSVSPHRDFDERAGFSEAFVESIELRDDLLYGRVALSPRLFSEVVEQGGWRGFSVEISKNLKTQTKDIPGWTLTGGVFTNRPAVDAHFRIAAEARAGSEFTGTYTAPITRPPEASGESMADEKATAQADGAKTVSLEFHNDKITAERDKVTALESSNRDLSAQAETLRDENKRLRLSSEQAGANEQEAKNAAAEAKAKANRLEATTKGLRDANAVLERELTESAEQIKAAQSENLSIKVREIVLAAIAKKVPPAMFDGYEDNPADWMRANYASLEAFEKQVSTMLGSGLKLETIDPTKSGRDSGKKSDVYEGLSDAEAKVIRAHSKLGVDFSGATNADEARAMLEAAKAESKN